MFLASVPNEELIDKAQDALDAGDWADARDMLDRLCVRGVRNAGLSFDGAPGGGLFELRRPAFAALLRDRVAELNAGG